MVKGNGPNIALQSDLVEAYRTTTLARHLKIKAYVGFPIYHTDGTLFGTLCGLDPLPKSTELLAEHDLFEMLSSVLTTVLQTELRVVASSRRLERLQLEALTDSLTQLFNRRAWDEFLAAEEIRCRRYGGVVTVLILDLNGLKQENDTKGHAAGDALLQRTGRVLRQVARENDMVARLGGDEFGIIAVECSLADGGQELLKRVRNALAAEGIKASVGIAEGTSSTGLKKTWEKADQRMYEEKQSLYTENALVS
ncbi:GGDEF domain protein [Synechococcus sp. PCC 7335]|nr:GGDEF domain protein [Synechococcus sp. PCC 7335]